MKALNRGAFGTLALFAGLTFLVSDAGATTCGSGTYPFPYTDVAGVTDAFCPGILEAYVLGVTKGTTATTFSPNDNVSRTQMTTFLQRSIDQGLRRNSRRAALGQWWTPKTSTGRQKVALPGAGPVGACKSDGEQIWVANGENAVSVVSSSGDIQADIAFFPGTLAESVVVADSRVYMGESLGSAIRIVFQKSVAPYYGVTNRVSVSFKPNSLAFDGDRIWSANYADGSIAIVSLFDGFLQLPGTVVGGFSIPTDILFDGTNIWLTEAEGIGKLRKLDANGGIVQTVTVGAAPAGMVYDGANIWVANEGGNSITVVQAGSGAIVATIASNAANRLSQPFQAAFDGERILVTNPGNDSVTLFRAADLSLIGNVQLAAGSIPVGTCSDGINFWVTLRGTKQLLRL